MSVCTDNPRLGITGCGQTYTAELQHCVARTDWTTQPDGRAHMSGRLSTIETCWRKGNGHQPADPATLGFEQNDRGVWRTPLDPDSAWAQNRAGVQP